MIPLHFATVLNQKKKKKLFRENLSHFSVDWEKLTAPQTAYASLFRGAGASFLRAQRLLKKEGERPCTRSRIRSGDGLETQPRACAKSV